MKPRLRAVRCLYLIAVVVMVTACGIVPKPQPYDTWRLPPSMVTANPGTPLDLALRIKRPVANDLLAGSRIAVLPDEHRLNAYQGARWSSPVPVLWRDHLLDAFHRDGRIHRLSSDAERIAADIELGGMLRGFQTEYSEGEPVVVLRMDAHLVHVASRGVIAQRRFEVSEPMQGAQVPQVVAAFGRASDRMAADIIHWTLMEVEE